MSYLSDISHHIASLSYCPQGRPGVNGYKGEKGDPGSGSGYGYPVSTLHTTLELDSDVLIS